MIWSTPPALLPVGRDLKDRNLAELDEHYIEINPVVKNCHLEE